MGRKELISPDQVAKEIQKWMMANGVPPTLGDLQNALKKICFVSTRTLIRYLDKLEEIGMIKQLAGPRGLMLNAGLSAGEETIAVPFYGGAPAGTPKLAEEIAHSWVHLPKEYLRPPSARFYLIRVDGDSMNLAKVGGAFLKNGDLVLVRHQIVADHREVVAALVDGKVVIKRLIKKDGYSVLMPDSTNKTHSPIIIGEDSAIQGVVVRVFKKGGDLLNG